MPVVRACALVGYSRASFYRHRSPRARLAAPIPQKDRHQPATLSTAESAQILALINTPEYEGFSICQAFYRAWDAGVYLASKSSWYRVARAAGQVHERRRQAEGSPKKIPELVATAPSQVWSWDITKLKTTIRGRYFHLYVIMDIYSRRVVGWRLEAYEDGDLAEELIQEAVTANHGVAPNSLHSDNGAAMVSTPVSLLLEKLGVDKSFSRPKVSNDNPYSEALFKTAKYDLAFPEIFDTTDDARAYFDWFFHEYNQNHRHSGIAWNTPNDVHYGRTDRVTRRRSQVLNTAFRTHPERYAQHPKPPALPGRVCINDPRQKPKPNLSQTG
ncbi:DDE-type integrase/transposase/recombinase [Cryobacterium sp. PAMC25264]|uniref:DDE-type integrase/transposase/recombinase n=1 Tax=Cryobacterium sp. PAMC25264 TaxID=2861288 RepID=UPI002105C97B|nr:DDE-type integrase/transposase/recombinase [Cryobacterium sp. PAMC25264]